MTSIKVKFRPSIDGSSEGSIFYQIIHERKIRQLNSAYKVLPSEWDERRETAITDYDSARMTHIMAIRDNIRSDIDRFAKIVRKLKNTGLAFTADDVVNEFVRHGNEYSMFNYMENIIINLKIAGRIRTSETYRATLNSFKKFRCSKDIMLDRLSTEIMENYEAWLKNRGIALNTISFYTRILRAVYNRAVENEIIENRQPFRHVYTGLEKTVKRALPLSIIKKIKTLDLSSSQALDFARDIFLLSFYLRGMSFIDMSFLKKSDLKNGHITYRRRKTGQQLIIEWTTEMQTILDKYPENKSIYLLPIIRNAGANERCAYRNTGYNINHNLKRIADMVGITIPLTLYVARHSWASAAKAKGIPVSVISEGMGHNSETTTKIYLASLDTSVVDKANSLIIKSLKYLSAMTE